MNEIKDLKYNLIETVIKSDDESFVENFKKWLSEHSSILNYDFRSDNNQINHVDYINDIISKVGDKYKGIDADTLINNIRGN